MVPIIELHREYLELHNAFVSQQLSALFGNLKSVEYKPFQGSFRACRHFCALVWGNGEIIIQH